MPLLKPQHLKSLSTINSQPQTITSRVEKIMDLDLVGHSTSEISEIIGISESRISVIKHSPLYQQTIKELKNKLSEKVINDEGERRVFGDPVEKILKEAAVDAAKEKVNLALNAESEFVRNVASSDILKLYKTNKVTTVIEIDEKVGSRLERVLKNEEFNSNERKYKIRVTQEVSNESL